MEPYSRHDLAGQHNSRHSELSLGAILANARHEAEIDEDRLTTWMHQHLRVVTLPVHDAHALNDLETEVLQRLDPPLNLDNVEKKLLPETTQRAGDSTGTRHRRQRRSEGRCRAQAPST